MKAVGLKLSDLMPDRDDHAPNGNDKSKPDAKTFARANAAVAKLEGRYGKRSALWTYCDATGNPVGLVVRWDAADGKKDIRPVSRHSDGWRIGAMPEPRPLYGMPDLAVVKRVIVCEGEKAADAARSLGFAATTSVGGSQAAGKTDWSPLAGKEVWILPDNDAPGRKYAESVADILANLTPPAVVRVVELPGLTEGGDIVDWIGAHGDAAEPDSMKAEIEVLARAAEPRAAELPVCDAEQFRPFPEQALPEPIRKFVVAGAEAIGCDPSYLALPLLVALAAAIGYTRCLELKRGWAAPATLWGMVVGESGTAKTPAFKMALRPSRNREAKAMKRNADAMTRYESESAYMQRNRPTKRDLGERADTPPRLQPPTAERYVVGDTTIEALAPILMENPRGLLLARDELSGWLGSFDRYAGRGRGGSDAATWLSMFNAESITVDRKTGQPRTIFVSQAAVCVVGGIQPAVLRRALGKEHRESGMAARFLLAYPPPREKEWTEADIDPDAVAAVARIVDRLYELQPIATPDGDPQPVFVRLSPEAKNLWTAYYDAHAAEQAGLTSDLAAAWSKLEEYAARLALVIHLVRWATGDPAVTGEDAVDTVDVDSMRVGISLATRFKGEARRVYAMLGDSAAESNQGKLVKWIGKQGGSVTPRAVQQRCRWLKESGMAEAALEDLVRSKLGVWEDRDTTNGGRPSRVFNLSTASTPSTVYDPGAGGEPVDGDGARSTDPTDFPFGQNNPGRDGLFLGSRGLPD